MRVMVLSYEGRHCATGTLYAHLYTRRRHHQAFEALQIRIREGNRHVRLTLSHCVPTIAVALRRITHIPFTAQVCILQETRLLLHRMHLLPGRLSRPRTSLPQRPRSRTAECYYRYHPFGGGVRGEGGGEGYAESSTSVQLLLSHVTGRAS